MSAARIDAMPTMNMGHQATTVFKTGIVAVAFLFSAAVGVIFGYFPALKAACMEPIDALRHE